jgi:hypothetical protein
MVLHYAVEQLSAEGREALASLRQGGAGVLWEGKRPVAVLMILPALPSFEDGELITLSDILKTLRQKEGRRRRGR